MSPPAGPPASARRPLSLPVPVGGLLAHRLVERNLTVYRRIWLTIVSGFFEPVFYLFALGIGLGQLVGDVEVGGRAVDYALFVAPALLAASAMNGAVYDSTFNIFFKLRYAKTYDAVLATPLGPRDVAVGEVVWAQVRGAIYSAAFLVVMVATGLVPSWWGLLALPAAMLIGLAFAALGMAATTYMRSWTDAEYVQLAILPMFLLSTTFFPLSVFPEPVQPLVQLTPLYHGVALLRGLVLGDMSVAMLAHVAVLAALAVAGVLISSRRLERLLLS